MDISSLHDFTPHIQLPDMVSQIETISKDIEEGKQDFINRLAEATGCELAKAIRTSPDLFDEIIGALSSLCGNPTYNSTTVEDSMNDYVRDILGHGLQVRDQTRQGISGNSRSAEKGRPGEIDIQIRNNGKPIGLYEGLRLESVSSKVIYDHIFKTTVKYNPQGIKEIFVVAYIINHSTGFGDFWKRFMECVRQYNTEQSEYQIVWGEEEDTSLSSVRSLHGEYYLDDVTHNVHVIAVKIME